MFHDDFGARLREAPTRWIEPPWKAVLSNKGILPLLWEMFPRHPNLLPAFFEDDPRAEGLGTSFVRKPLYSREGANVSLISGGVPLAQQEGPYGGEGFIRQARRRCGISTCNIPSSGAGWSITRRAGFPFAKTKARSRATIRASCRTRLFEPREDAQRAATTLSGARAAPRARFGR